MARQTGARLLGRLLPLFLQSLVVGALLAVAALVVAAAGPTFFGRTSLIVMGGSMEPTIHVGSVVVVERVRPQTIRPADVISFVTRDEQMVTHRVVAVLNDQAGLGFETMGDANESPDPDLIRPVNVVGRVMFSVPLAGFVIFFGNQPAPRAILMAVAAVLLIGYLANSARRKRDPAQARTGG